jgi:hypothetical protein
VTILSDAAELEEDIDVARLAGTGGIEASH